MWITMQKIITLAEKVLNGQDITKEEAEFLINVSDDDTMLLLALVVLGMLFLTGAYTLSYNRYRQYMVEQSYRNHWFDILSQNSENVFLIYDANLKKNRIYLW